MAARATIEIVSGAPHARFSVPAAGLAVGRSPDSGLLLDVASVSGSHARFFWRGDDLCVEDRGSRFGTLRDGVPVDGREPLLDGDELLLGKTILLRVALPDGHRARSPSDLADTTMALAPTAADPRAQPRPVDLAPLLDAMRAETTARGVCAALLRATRAELRLSRAVVLETEDDMGTFRVLGVEGADDATFASRTVVADARRSGVALHVAKFGDAAASIAASGAGSAAAAAVRSKAGKSRVLYGDRPAGEPALAWVDALTIQVLVAHAASILDGLSHQHEIAAQRLQFEQLRRYFSPAVIQHLLAQDEGAILKPQQLHVTVLFADLTGYTAIAERMAGRADALFALLNRWLDAGARAVLGQGGTLDKFIGDAVMAVFGAPYPLPQAVQRAARCALEMRGALETIGLELGERLALTVGIHSGPVLAGSVGSQRRLEYTVLGDTVNVSARLQGLAKPGEILLSEDAAREIGNDAELVGVGPLQLKNRQHAVQTFRLVALRV